MKYNKLFILIGLFLFLGLGSCSKKDKETPCSTAWATDLQANMNAITTAAQAYAANQTPANCNAYKNAYQSYINALAPYGNCATLTVQQKTAFNDALAAANAALAAFTC